MAVNLDALKAAQARGLTTGLVLNPGSPLPLRLEIDDFLQDTELANLYFLALASYMSEGAAKSPFSYYEIAGIHGQPNRSWNRQPQSSEWVPNGPDRGARRYSYCAHSSLVFPTWHRAYLAQYEQGLYVHAAALAPALKAERVLDRFRIPFFDPLLPRQLGNRQYTYGIPIIFTLPRINVKKTAEGPWEPMDNPLYSYKFGDAGRAEMNFSSWGSLRNPSRFTMRAYDFQRDQPNHEILIRAFDNLYNPNLNLSTQGFDNLYRVMMDDRQTWATMSNSARSGDLGMNSLEGFHDNLHVQVSWGMPGRVNQSPRGHMSNPDFAAFDPTFWLHHCNVDRLCAIWQGLKSEAPEAVRWWAGGSRPRNDPNDRQPASFWSRGPETDLVPFVRAQSGGRDVYLKSNDLRDHRTLGHDYPETAAARRATRETYVQSLRRWANTELGWLGRVTREGDPTALARLNDSLNRNIPFFPKEILIDGDRNRPLRGTQAFIGSKFTAAPPTRTPAPVARGIATPDVASQFSTLAVSNPGDTPPLETRAANQEAASRAETAEPVAARGAPTPEKEQPRGLLGLTSKLAAKVVSAAETKESDSPAGSNNKGRSHGLSALAAKAAAKVVSATEPKATTSQATSSTEAKGHRRGLSATAFKFGSKAMSAAAAAATAVTATASKSKTDGKQNQGHGITALASKIRDAAHDAVEEFHGDVHATIKDAHEALHERVLRNAIPALDLGFQERFGHLADLISNERITQWNVTYTVDKFCLDGSFVINFFLGDFDSHSGQWVLDGHLVGQSAVFASDRSRIEGEDGCENCRQQEQEGLVYGDTVGLTEALLVYYGNREEVYGRRITNLRPEIVVPFLTRNLHWRIESAMGGEAERQSVPSLRIGVFSETVSLPHTVTELPRFEARTLHYGVTAGRPNGLNPGETF